MKTNLSIALSGDAFNVRVRNTVKIKFLYITLYCSLLLFGSLDLLAQGATCGSSTILCSSSVSFAGATGVPSTGASACLTTTPNPSYFTLPISQSGNLVLNISGGANDVDAAIYGPYATTSGNCGGTFPTGAHVDCGDGVGGETLTVNGVIAGQVYILLITNFSDAAGTITVNPGGGNTADIGGAPLTFGTNGPYNITDPAEILDVNPDVTDPSITDEIFSGPGIVNVMTGFFSPGFAGPGTHTVGVQATYNGCPTGLSTTEISVCNLLMSCKSATLTLDANCEVTLSPSDINNGSSDSGCSPITYTLDDGTNTGATLNFDINDIGTQTVTLIGTNDAGQTASCEATVEIEQPCPEGEDITLTVDGANSVSLDNPIQICDNASVVNLDISVAGCMTTGSYSASSSNPAFNNASLTDNSDNSATFDPSISGLGTHIISFNYTCPGTGEMTGKSVTFLVVAAPTADVVDFYELSCGESSGTLFLANTFEPGSSNIGTWTKLSGPPDDGTMSNPAIDSEANTFRYINPGCYEFRFTASDPNNCSAVDPFDDVFVYIQTSPVFSFNVQTVGTDNIYSGGCLPFGQTVMVDANVVTSETGTSTTGTVSVNGGAETTWDLGSYSIIGPGTSSMDMATTDYEFCVTMQKTGTETCDGMTVDIGDADCQVTQCRSLSVFNDGNNCNSSSCETNEVDVCDISVDPRLTLSCSFLNLSVPLDIVGADIVPNSQVISCGTREVDINYIYEFAMQNVGSGAGGQTIGDLPGVSIICDVFNFCICIDLGFLGDITFRPFSALYDALGCDETIASFVLNILATLIGGDGGGFVVVADTDGDGAFDYDVASGTTTSGADGDSATVPVNIVGQGDLTIRMVSAWPNMPAGVCGQATVPGTDLLTLLPIGAIPIVGPTVVAILDAAQCNIDLSWSNEETVVYKVVNTEGPKFVNCNEEGYTFSDLLTCETPANWSIPVAIDSCSQDVLPFMDDYDFNLIGVRKVPLDAMGNQVDPMDDESPDIGDFLEVGIYPVMYRATSCNGQVADCAFNIVVSAGDPELLAPNDVEVCTDIDRCNAIVLGLAPLKGIGCNTTISYYTTGATTIGTMAAPILPPAGSTVADVSGETFNLGLTTITYIMTWVDEFGVEQVLMDSFNVFVRDCQKPVAECHSITVQLDNTGNVTITAEDVDALSSDNCTIAEDLTLMIRKGSDPFSSTVSFDCSEIGVNFVTLEVNDNALTEPPGGNISYCLATVTVLDFFDGVTVTMDVPELCLEANNPEQFDFTNYLNITLSNGTIIEAADVPTLLGGDVVGLFGITSFIPSANYMGNMPPEIGMGPGDPGDIGYIDPFTGVYTPGTGSGFVTISYVLSIGDQVSQDNSALGGCFLVVHETFELKQPLVLTDPMTGLEWDPMCECLGVDSRQVVLGTVTGGLEPYRVFFDGGTLDYNSDGFPDVIHGTFTFDEANGFNINDGEQDIGLMWLNYTSPIWSITVVDARGCEIARSGSCDIIDLTVGPTIDCVGANDFDTEVHICERQYEWFHAIPSDNCAVTQYSYRIINPDGTISGPFTLDAIIDDADDGVPLSELLEAEYEFELGTSIVSYYAEDAVGNFTTCEFTVVVEDNDPPYFINCPYPDVIVSTEFGHCDAFVNFALPLAQDNCVIPTVTQIDDSGLEVGDRFPIGTTILTYQALDAVGNKAICKVKVIVDNYWNVPTITCPADVTQSNDEWLCGAVVNGIGAVAEELCSDNLIKVYQVEQNGVVLETGLDDASGTYFDVGESTVSYKVQNQPLLLISEISQDADALIGGMNPPPITNEFQCLSDTLFALGNGDVGEGLVYYPVDDLLYHYSGATDGNEYFEEIYFPGMCVQPNNVLNNTHGPDPASQITGMVWDPVTMKFIAMDVNGDIFTVSTTGDYLQISTYDQAFPLAGFAIVGGAFYGVDQSSNNLYEFDPTTGATTGGPIAMVSTGDAIVTGIDIATDPLSGDVYIIYLTGASATAYMGTLDVMTGVITELGDTFIDFAGITIDATGQVYGVSSKAAGADLYTIKCAIPGDDYIEVTNFGPATYDISCLVIERTLPTGEVESFVVPEGTVLAPGDVLVLHYGPGVDNHNPPSYFLNYCEASDQAANAEIPYSIYFDNNIIDEMTMFADAQAGIIRKDIFDTDTPADFVLADDCMPLTLGEYNPTYPDPVDNGTSTSLQSEPKAEAECDFTVTVLDVEPPMCMEINDTTIYMGPPVNAVEGECNQSIISVPEADDCILTEINVAITGAIVGAEFITVSVISPQNDTLILYDKLCSGDSPVNIVFDDESENPATDICGSWNGDFRPQDEMLMKFYTSKLAGDWTLFVNVEEGNGASFDITTWSIEATCMMDWEMADVEINNDPGLCGAEFTWIHPYFVDNCTFGTISVDYFSDDDIEVPEGGLLTDNFGKGGFEVTEFFEVGTTTVEYTLVDLAGNVSQCSFTVTVLDVEDPVVTFCPDDIVIQLDGGECRARVCYDVEAIDNCEVSSIVGVPPSCSFFEIGVTLVVVTITDPSGNMVTCEFTVTVLEYEPASNQLACNDGINLSLDTNCEAALTADMLLEGNEYGCYEHFCIFVETEGGIPHDTIFTLDDVGQTFIVTVADCEDSTNSCWTTVTVEEKYDPVIVCPPDTLIACNVDVDARENGILRLGEAYVSNCEEETTFTYADDFIDNGQCNDGNIRAQILRTWMVVDGDGNQASCTQTINIANLNINDIVFPDDLDIDSAIACTDPYGEDPDLHPDVTGYPTLNGHPIHENNGLCQMSWNYDDQLLNICGGSYEILRTWIVRDMCEDVVFGINPINYIQVIKVLDQEAPIIAPCPDDMTISVDPWICTAQTILPLPHKIEDNCSAFELEWAIYNGGTLAIDTSAEGTIQYVARNLTVGNHPIELTATDECGNVSECIFNIYVIDQAPPTAVAKTDIVVTLAGGGTGGDATAKLFAEDVDLNSHDNCSGVWYEIRRDSDPCGVIGNSTYSDKIPEICDPWYDMDDHDYGQEVKFCCVDLTEVDSITGVQYGIVKVWLRVWDDANMDGVHGSYTYYDNPGNDHDYCEIHDNYNEIWVNVRVEDKAPTSLICPPDITIPCDWDYTDLSITGEAVALGTCESPIAMYTDWPEIHCGEGYVLREWSVPGASYVCVQTITISYVESPMEIVCPDYMDFDNVMGNPEIQYFDPFNTNHITVDCANFEFPEPWVSGGKCDLIGVSSSVDTLWFEEDACFKAIKTWDYVNWCTDQEAQCEFVVSVIDTEAPVIACQDTCIAVDDYWDSDNDGITCELASDINVVSMALDQGDCGSEWIKWIAHVDFWYDGSIDVEYSSFLPHNDPFYLAPTMSGSEVSIRLDKDDVSAEWAQHIVEWKAFDGCGNIRQCLQLVEIADKKAPTPYCVGVSTALMAPEAGNLVEIWAKDFNVGSTDNCTQEHWLGYTFGEVPPVQDLIDEDHCFEVVWDDRDNCIPLRDAETGYILSAEVNNCNGYENGATRPDCPIDGIQKWSPNGLDEEGNPCKTSGIKFKGLEWCGQQNIRISVWDTKMNMDFCAVELLVHGTECPDDPTLLEGTIAGEIRSHADDATVDQVIVKNSSEIFAGGQLQMLTESDGYYEFDNLLMNGAYAISAEKRDDYLNGVSTLDISKMQRHILAIEPFDSGYKVIAADVNNDEKVSAIDLVELRKLILGVYNELPNNNSWRFLDKSIPVDLHFPWPLREVINIDVLNQDRMNEHFTAVKVGDVNNSASANIMDIKAEARSLTGVDMVTEFIDGQMVFKAGTNFKEVYGYQFTMKVKGSLVQIIPGAIEDITDAHFAKHKDGILTTSYNCLQPKDVESGDVLFSLVGIEDVKMVDGVTTAEAYIDEVLNVTDIHLRSVGEDTDYALYQNEPNPFLSHTEIRFDIAKEGEVTISFTDITGKEIMEHKAVYKAGSHKIVFDRSAFEAGGVINYQLECGDFKESRRMIILN